jgi:hypothetical protein
MMFLAVILAMLLCFLDALRFKPATSSRMLTRSILKSDFPSSPFQLKASDFERDVPSVKPESEPEPEEEQQKTEAASEQPKQEISNTMKDRLRDELRSQGADPNYRYIC